jgi:ATP-dependent DNA ligase
MMLRLRPIAHLLADKLLGGATERADDRRALANGSRGDRAPPRMSRWSPLPVGFVPPCLPTGSKGPPSGREWLHEIKHDGFRVIARKIGKRVKLCSRPGNDLTKRFPLIGEP